MDWSHDHLIISYVVNRLNVEFPWPRLQIKIMGNKTETQMFEFALLEGDELSVCEWVRLYRKMREKN